MNFKPLSMHVSPSHWAQFALSIPSLTILFNSRNLFSQHFVSFQTPMPLSPVVQFPVNLASYSGAPVLQSTQLGLQIRIEKNEMLYMCPSVTPNMAQHFQLKLPLDRSLKMPYREKCGTKQECLSHRHLHRKIFCNLK